MRWPLIYVGLLVVAFTSGIGLAEVIAIGYKVHESWFKS